MRQPSAPAKSMPRSRASSDAAGPMCSLRLGVLVEVVDAEEERVDRRPLEAEGDGLQHRVGHAGRLRPVDALELARRLGGPEGRPGSARVTPGRDGGGLDGEREETGGTSDVSVAPARTRVGGEAGGAVRGGRRRRAGARPRRSVRALRQPRQRRQHAAACAPCSTPSSASCRTTPACTGAAGYKSRAEHRGLRAGPRHRRATSSAPTPTATSSCSRKNTTEAINKLARSMPMADDAVVLTTRARAPLQRSARGGTGPHVVHVRARADGTLDEDDLDRQLARLRRPGRAAGRDRRVERHRRRPADPRLAEKVHAVGGRILVDAAQLAAHRADRHARPRRPRAPRLRRPLGPQDVRAVRQRRARRAPDRASAPSPTIPAAARSTPSPLDDVVVGRPPRPGGGAAARTCVGAVALGRGDAGARRHRPRADRRPRGRADPRTPSSGCAAVPGLTLHGPAPSRRRRPGRGDPVHHRRPRPRPRGRGARLRARQSACAAAASAPTPTSPICSGLTLARRRRGWPRSARATSGARPGWCGSASAATTTAPTSTGPSRPSSGIVAGDIDGHYEQGLDGTYVPGGLPANRSCSTSPDPCPRCGRGARRVWSVDPVAPRRRHASRVVRASHHEHRLERRLHTAVGPGPGRRTSWASARSGAYTASLIRSTSGVLSTSVVTNGVDRRRPVGAGHGAGGRHLQPGRRDERRRARRGRRRRSRC